MDNVFQRSYSMPEYSVAAKKLHKRKYDRKVLPPSEIKTRGVKLPSYSHNIYDRRKKLKSEADTTSLLDDLNNQLNSNLKNNSIPASKVRSPSPRNTENQDTKDFDLIYGNNSVCTFKGEVKLKLESNPLYWSVQDVVDYIKETDSWQFARILKEQVKF